VLFDNETDWWTAAIVGSFDGTPGSLTGNLEVLTLAESDDFGDEDEAGAYLLDLVKWSDSVNHKRADEEMLQRHREVYEAAHAKPVKPRRPKTPARVIEVKPETVGYRSTLSWQQIRRCNWATYWNALLEADRLRGARVKDSLCGPAGWLVGIDAAHEAFGRGPDAWTQEKSRDEILGRTPATGLLGSVTSAEFATLLLEDAAFRDELHAAVEGCLADPTADGLREALGSIVTRPEVTVAEASRFLTAAAPDRFFSIQGEAMQLRLSNIVGFDLGGKPADLQDQLERYADAVEVIGAFPWAAERSVERASDHVREPDAWARRVALLGSLIC